VRKFLAQRVAGERLKLSGKLSNRPMRVSLNKEVNVIGHHFQGGNRSLQLGRFLFQEFPQAFFDGVYQNRAAILIYAFSLDLQSAHDYYSALLLPKGARLWPRFPS
jgi:hypothetical protein